MSPAVLFRKVRAVPRLLLAFQHDATDQYPSIEPDNEETKQDDVKEIGHVKVHDVYRRFEDIN